MLSKLTSHINQKKSQESGLSLPEVLVAAVIIVLVLTFTAAGLASSFGISGKTENSNKATQAINDQIAIAKQARYADLGMKTPTAAETENCSPWTTTFNGEQKVITSVNYPSLNYCLTKQYSNVGIKFYIETQITYVNDTSYDNSIEPVTVTNTSYQPKRVTVTVRWSDTVDDDGEAIPSSRTMTWVETPSIQECIPPGLSSTATSPATGCIGS